METCKGRGEIWYKNRDVGDLLDVLEEEEVKSDL